MSTYQEVIEDALRYPREPPKLPPYLEAGLPLGVARVLDKEISGGVRVGDLVPLVSSLPPGNSPLDTLPRPRETWKDWATLPAEVLSFLGIGPPLPIPKNGPEFDPEDPGLLGSKPSPPPEPLLPDANQIRESLEPLLKVKGQRDLKQVLRRPRESWYDWATLPAETLGLLHIGPSFPVSDGILGGPSKQ